MKNTNNINIGNQKMKELCSGLKKGLLLICLICSSAFLFAQEMTTAQAKINREKFISEIKQYVGKPYKYGAIGPDEFDCSGLIYYTASKATGIQLPRTAKAIYNYVKIVPSKNREIGDLLFFRTTETGGISHVGVYIGNNQFISAISDGPNTGVIVSSLNQDYWKPKYAATGQFLPAGNIIDEIEVEEPVLRNEKKTVIKSADKKMTSTDKKNTNKSKKNDKDVKTVKGKTSSSSSMKKVDGTFQDNFIMDGAFFIDWSLVTPKSFAFKFRGVDLNLNARYAKWEMEPGLGLGFRYNAGIGIFQMPLTVSLTINDHFRAYAGPVFSFGDAKLIDTKKEVSPSIFPGVIGLSFSTNKLEFGKTIVQFTQDVSYTVYNNMDGSALSPLESVAAGLIFYTGVKVTLPLSAITG